MKIGIIIQARNGSTRLPKKVTLPFYNNQTILEIILIKLKKLSLPIVIATTTNPEDDNISLIAKKEKAYVFRGNENNVLKRFIDCSHKFNFSHIIRVCADNPFLDIELISEMIQKDIDYSAHFFKNKASIKTHWGIFSEFVSLNALKKINLLTNAKIFQEHVTNYIYENQNEFKISKLNPPKICINKNIRLTVDTKNDFEIAKKIYQLCIQKNKFKLEHIINCINQDIKQKMIHEIKNNNK